MARVNEEKLFQVIVAPHVSEKSTRLADKERQIVFEVRRDASKPVIKLAVEKMFNVQVESVTLTNVKGKRKQTGRMPGRRQDWKKAYVRLKPGQDINFVGQQ
ncbi:MAG: 50S ribosomal protein L23 [Gammaproteobacteria bacterium]|nr:50S ribosomal protein L23 [Gammaproteobacteria bacterium]